MFARSVPRCHFPMTSTSSPSPTWPRPKNGTSTATGARAAPAAPPAPSRGRDEVPAPLPMAQKHGSARVRGVARGSTRKASTSRSLSVARAEPDLVAGPQDVRVAQPAPIDVGAVRRAGVTHHPIVSLPFEHRVRSRDGVIRGKRDRALRASSERDAHGAQRHHFGAAVAPHLKKRVSHLPAHHPLDLVHSPSKARDRSRTPLPPQSWPSRKAANGDKRHNYSRASDAIAQAHELTGAGKLA